MFNKTEKLKQQINEKLKRLSSEQIATLKQGLDLALSTYMNTSLVRLLDNVSFSTSDVRDERAEEILNDTLNILKTHFKINLVAGKTLYQCISDSLKPLRPDIQEYVDNKDKGDEAKNRFSRWFKYKVNPVTKNDVTVIYANDTQSINTAKEFRSIIEKFGGSEETIVISNFNQLVKTNRETAQELLNPAQELKQIFSSATGQKLGVKDITGHGEDQPKLQVFGQNVKNLTDITFEPINQLPKYPDELIDQNARLKHIRQLARVNPLLALEPQPDIFTDVEWGEKFLSDFIQACSLSQDPQPSSSLLEFLDQQMKKLPLFKCELIIGKVHTLAYEQTLMPFIKSIAKSDNFKQIIKYISKNLETNDEDQRVFTGDLERLEKALKIQLFYIQKSILGVKTYLDSDQISQRSDLQNATKSQFKEQTGSILNLNYEALRLKEIFNFSINTKPENKSKSFSYPSFKKFIREQANKREFTGADRENFASAIIEAFVNLYQPFEQRDYFVELIRPSVEAFATSRNLNDFNEIISVIEDDFKKRVDENYVASDEEKIDEKLIRPYFDISLNLRNLFIGEIVECFVEDKSIEKKKPNLFIKLTIDNPLFLLNLSRVKKYKEQIFRCSFAILLTFGTMAIQPTYREMGGVVINGSADEIENIIKILKANKTDYKLIKRGDQGYQLVLSLENNPTKAQTQMGNLKYDIDQAGYKIDAEMKPETAVNQDGLVNWSNERIATYRSNIDNLIHFGIFTPLFLTLSYSDRILKRLNRKSKDRK
jgi:hypothetical protein